jgi:hypothetical protein
VGYDVPSRWDFERSQTETEATAISSGHAKNFRIRSTEEREEDQENLKLSEFEI